jgi:O-antigen ligase
MPWKVEFLFSAFLTALLMICIARSRSSLSVYRLYGSNGVRFIVVYVAMFTVWSGVSTIWAATLHDAIHHTFTWAVYLVSFVFLEHILLSTKQVTAVTNALAITAVILSVLCLFDYLSIEDFASAEGTIRIRYAKYAELLITASPVLWALVLYSRRRKQMLVMYIPAVAAWSTVMLSLSKGAFIAGIFGFGIFFAGAIWFSHGVFRRRTASMACIWVALTVAVQLGFTLYSSVPSTTDYISGNADSSRSTSNMRIFTWKLGMHMFSTNPILGVGANNFGIALNESRSAVANAEPENPESEIGEDYLFERAHNEFLQIAAELGMIGAGLFAAAILSFAIFTFRALRNRVRSVSPFLMAGIGGLVAFFVSSLFSSFSFRAIQNGLVFIAVLTLTVHQILKLRSKARVSSPVAPGRSLRLATAASIVITAAFTAFSFSRGVSQFYVFMGEREPNYTIAVADFKSALFFDSSNSGANLAWASRASYEKDFSTAAQLYQLCIDQGLGVTITYSLLADALEKGGDLAGAERALGEAVRIFPRSIFTRVRYAVVLEQNGKFAESESEIRKASAMNIRQTNGWYTTITDGILAGHIRSRSDPDSAAPPELLPASAIYFYADEPIGPIETPQG